MRRLALLAASALVAAAPAHAQRNSGAAPQSALPPTTSEHAGHDGAAPEKTAPDLAAPGHEKSGQDMAGMDHSAHAPASAAASDAPGNAAPPPQATDHPADRFFPGDRMAAARAALLKEGAFTGSALMVDQLEYRARAGRDGYAWKVSGWYGGDIDRAVLASEGEGELGGPTERAEVRAMWRRAIGPWFNLEAGVRHDFRPDPERTYAALGIEGLAPYWFEVEGQAFVSNRGDIHLRIGGSHDVRLSGPLVLQPEAEMNVALQDVPELGIGSGIERIELGARLRYEFKPDFAPYVGVHWERSLGGTADALRADGERASAVSAVVGLRAGF